MRLQGRVWVDVESTSMIPRSVCVCVFESNSDDLNSERMLEDHLSGLHWEDAESEREREGETTIRNPFCFSA